MLDDIDPLHTPGDHISVDNAANNDFGAPRPDFIGFQPFLVIEADHLVPLVDESLHQRLASKPCAACYKYFHEFVLSSIKAYVSQSVSMHACNFPR